MRDPKTDPRASDILKVGGWLWTVISANDTWIGTCRVHATTGQEPWKREVNFDHVSWVARMKKARVMAMGVNPASQPRGTSRH